MRKARVERGHFLPTVQRHIRFISGFTENDTDEIRFVTPDGREWKPVSSYKSDDGPLVYVDVEPVEFVD